MTTLFILLLCMIFGMFLRSRYAHATQLSIWLLKIVVWICLPAMVLAYMPKLKWHWDYLYPMAVPYLNFILSFVVFYGLYRIVRSPFSSDQGIEPRRRLGSLILMSGLGNTAFVGFPFLLAFYGSQALDTAIVIDQAGSFIVVATLALFCAAYFSGEALEFKVWLRRTLTYPSFAAFMVSILMSLGNYELLPQVDKAMFIIASPLSYLAMILSGLNLRLRWTKEHKTLLAFSLAFKLILFPLMILGLYSAFGWLEGLPLKVTVMQAAMPPMVSAGILALEYHLDEDLAMLDLAVGIPLSFVTLIGWYYALEFWF